MKVDHKVVATKFGIGLAIKIETDDDIIIEVSGPYDTEEAAEQTFATKGDEIVKSSIERAAAAKAEAFAKAVIEGACAQEAAEQMTASALATAAKPDAPKPNLH